MAWEIEATDEFTAWFLALDDGELGKDSAAVDAVIAKLAEAGPGLRRPLVGQIKGSSHPMRELIPRGGHLRVLFVFDPRRHAVLLVGGDKTDNWKGWYDDAIAKADQLYDDYLDDLREEGVIP